MPRTGLDTTSFPGRGRVRSRPELTIVDPELHGTTSVASAPVQIPPSRRTAPPILGSNNGNLGFGSTPEAVFDMSPVTSEHGSSASPCSHTDRRGSDKFLYNLPSLPHRPLQNQHCIPSRHGRESPSSPTTSELNAEVASRHRVSDPLASRRSSRSPYLCKGSNVLDDYDLSPGGMSPDSYSPMKENHRTHGFHPLPFQRVIRSKTSLSAMSRPSISPGPRQSLGETSPWLFPGRGARDDREGNLSPGEWSKKGSREDVASSCSYSHVDPAVFEFKNHLLKRLESRYPSRLNMGPNMQ